MILSNVKSYWYLGPGLDNNIPYNYGGHHLGWAPFPQARARLASSEKDAGDAKSKFRRCLVVSRKISKRQQPDFPAT